MMSALAMVAASDRAHVTITLDVEKIVRQTGGKVIMPNFNEVPCSKDCRKVIKGFLDNAAGPAEMYSHPVLSKWIAMLAAKPIQAMDSLQFESNVRYRGNRGVFELLGRHIMERLQVGPPTAPHTPPPGRAPTATPSSLPANMLKTMNDVPMSHWESLQEWMLQPPQNGNLTLSDIGVEVNRGARPFLANVKETFTAQKDTFDKKRPEGTPYAKGFLLSLIHI